MAPRACNLMIMCAVFMLASQLVTGQSVTTEDTTLHSDPSNTNTAVVTPPPTPASMTIYLRYGTFVDKHERYHADAKKGNTSRGLAIGLGAGFGLLALVGLAIVARVAIKRVIKASSEQGEELEGKVEWGEDEKAAEVVVTHV